MNVDIDGSRARRWPSPSARTSIGVIEPGDQEKSVKGEPFGFSRALGKPEREYVDMPLLWEGD